MRELSKSRLLQRVIAMIQAGRPPKGPREKWQMLSDTSWATGVLLMVVKKLPDSRCTPPGSKLVYNPQL